MSSTNDHSEEPSEIDDILNVASKGWNRLISAAEKAGFRDGIEDGSESVFQEAFDKGYADGFKAAFALGKLKSLQNTIPDSKDRHDINQILDNSRRGACYICEVESKGTGQISEDKELSEIVKKQQSHSKEIIEKLHIYFEPVNPELTLETLNIE